VFVALDIQLANRMRRIAIYGRSGSTIFSHIFSWTERLSKKLLLNIKCVSWFLYNFYLKRFSF